MGMVFVVILTALASGFIQAVSGFGGALILMMTLPYFVSMKAATALAGLICVPMCITIALKYRRQIKVKPILIPTAIYLVSSAICIKIAAAVNLESFKAIFGLILIGLALYFNFFSQGLHLEGNFKTAFVCAGLSGVTGGMFGVGGPLLVLYYLAVTKRKEEYLGTINLVFSITESYSAMMRYFNGLITPELYSAIGYGFAAILVGRFFGSRVVERLDGEKMKRFIYFLLGVSGAVTFLRGTPFFEH